MKEGWEIKTLKEIADYFIGLTYSPKDVSDKGTIVLRSSNVQNGELDFTDIVRVNKKIKESLKVKEGDILMCSRNGSKRLVGKTAIITGLNEEMTFGTFMTVIRSKYNSYLSWFFISDEFREQIGGGENTAINQITKYMLDVIEIPFPPLPEQQRIVAILDQAFAAIDKAKVNVEQNLISAKELFESYLKSVLENKGEDWEEKKLNEISENLDSKRVPITKNVRNDGLIPYYGASGIVDYVANYLFDEALLCISEDGANLLARTYPIAFSISGKTWVNNHAHVLRFKNIVSQKFVELYLNSIKLNDFVSGMAQPKLNQTMLNKIPIPFPPLKTQQAIVNNLDALFTETRKLEAIYQKKINYLEELKKTVLQKAFNGELKISKAVAV